MCHHSDWFWSRCDEQPTEEGRDEAGLMGVSNFCVSSRMTFQHSAGRVCGVLMATSHTIRRVLGERVWPAGTACSRVDVYYGEDLPRTVCLCVCYG